jgi:N-acetylglucosaminyldiphosphoundecaprenol N-acetyl-beta-D-mannosaminyltransferase
LDPYYPKDLKKCESQKVFRDILSAKFPKLDFDFYIYSDNSSDEVFEKIKKSGAKILFSTLGMKKQELSVIL